MGYTYYIGIDIASDNFEAALHGSAAKPERFSNSSEGFAEFCTKFADILPGSLVVLEATGGYENALLLELCRQEVAVHRVQPLKASHYMRSLRVNGKTDALDSMALAKYGAERHENLSLFYPAEENLQLLQDLHMRRSDLMKMRIAELQRSKHPRYARLRQSVGDMLEMLDKEIAKIQEQMSAIIEESHRLRQKHQILTSFGGVGETTAMALLACMPELGTLSRKQAASLAGLAPHPNDSGRTSGYRATRGGRKDVRNALYMAALSAKAYNPQLKEFYDRLILKGKKPIVAMTAVMRKMIVILNAKIRDECYA
jgi:transposase